MLLQSPQDIVRQVHEYGHFDPEEFLKISRIFLEASAREGFGIHTQLALRALIELKVDLDTITAFLIFCLPVRQTGSPVRVEAFLSQEVQSLVDSLENLRDFVVLRRFPQQQAVDSVRKMFLAMANDLRVVLVLMAIRYADLFEIERYSPLLQRQIVQQTLEVFVPLAGRLGIYRFKRQMEDRCFAQLYHADHEHLREVFAKRPELNHDTAEHLAKEMKAFLDTHQIKAEVIARVKGFYSTYQKLKRKGTQEIDHIHDLLAVRVIVDQPIDCYTVLGLVNNRWDPVKGRFKDYITRPKANGYQSLHTAI
ncbi:MAG: HD domain-containing protein, partial [bacterium]|nr:HD domain-containing protein [bacterium]